MHCALICKLFRESKQFLDLLTVRNDITSNIFTASHCYLYSISEADFAVDFALDKNLQLDPFLIFTRQNNLQCFHDFSDQ